MLTPKWDPNYNHIDCTDFCFGSLFIHRTPHATRFSQNKTPHTFRCTWGLTNVFPRDSWHGLHTTQCCVVNIEQDQTMTLSVIVRRCESDSLLVCSFFHLLDNVFIQCQCMYEYWFILHGPVLNIHWSSYLFIPIMHWTVIMLTSTGGICTIYLSVCPDFICVLFFFSSSSG